MSGQISRIARFRASRRYRVGVANARQDSEGKSRERPKSEGGAATAQDATPTPSGSGVGVLDKSVRLLEVLADGQRRNLAEMTAATGLARATVHRLLHALEHHRLTRMGQDDRWELGGRLGELTGRSRSHQLAVIARPVLDRLRDVTGESTQLYVRRGDRRLCVAVSESPHSLRTIVSVGAELTLSHGSAARVLTEDPATQRKGWAQSVEERERGVTSVSAPVRVEGNVVAALSVSGPVERTSRTPGRHYSAAVLEAAATLEAMLAG